MGFALTHHKLLIPVSRVCTNYIFILPNSQFLSIFPHTFSFGFRLDSHEKTKSAR